MSPCKVKYTKQKIKHNGCTSSGPVTVASCSGECESSATFSALSPYYEQECRCCKPVQFGTRDIRMVCLRGGMEKLRLSIIKRCVCNACSEENKGITGTTASPKTTEEPTGSGTGSGSETTGGSGSETAGGSGSGSGSETGSGSEGESGGGEPTDESPVITAGKPSANGAARLRRSISDLFYRLFMGKTK